MARQIRRFSPHQTAKVFAVLMAVSFIPFFALMAILTPFAPTPVDPGGNAIEVSATLFIILPLVYLVFGYVSVAIGCWLYNFLYRFVGGIEIEVDGD